MTVENLNPEKLSEISIKIRQGTPDYKWGYGELLNAIFEELVIEQDLPWNHDGGYPDWSDPRVKALNEEVTRILDTENRSEKIQGIQARCQTNDCGWEGSGDLTFEKVSRTVTGGSLINICRKHLWE